MPDNRSFNYIRSKQLRDDEFYTLIEDVIAEMHHYQSYFKDASIYCPCDGPDSSFFHYFNERFETLQLKSLRCNAYDRPVGRTYYRTREKAFGWRDLDHYGSFESYDSLEWFSDADIVCTNPPFSHWIAFIEQIIKSNCNFIVIGNGNAISYTNTFKHFHEGRLGFGVNDISKFKRPDGSIGAVHANWYTSLDHGVSPAPLELTVKYDSSLHPKYDNYDAINVDRISDIPMDYYGKIGVPHGFLKKHVIHMRHSANWDIIGNLSDGRAGQSIGAGGIVHVDADGSKRMHHMPHVNGKRKAGRCIIQRNQFEVIGHFNNGIAGQMIGAEYRTVKCKGAGVVRTYNGPVVDRAPLGPRAVIKRIAY